MATATSLFAALSGDFLVIPSHTNETYYAGLVIIPDTGNPQTECVSFSKPSISGLELIDLAGIHYEAQDGFMNSISDLANPDGGSMYWSYWEWNGREWFFKNTGAGEANVTHSSIEAWFFTSWEVFPSLPPTYIPNLREICEMPILKDYSIQPYLAYQEYLLSDQSFDQTSDQNPTLEPSPPENAINETQVPNPTTEPNEEPEVQRSFIPVLIIGGVGVVLLIAILYYSRRKQ